jgi:hypothetical protein
LPALALGVQGAGGATQLNAICEFLECVKFGEGLAKLQSTQRDFSDSPPIARDRFKDVLDNPASFKISCPVNGSGVLVADIIAALFQLRDHQLHPF